MERGQQPTNSIYLRPAVFETLFYSNLSPRWILSGVQRRMFFVYPWTGRIGALVEGMSKLIPSSHTFDRLCSIGSLVASLSNGNVCLLTPSEGSILSLKETWHAHDYEPWIAAWNYWDQNTIFTGTVPPIHSCLKGSTDYLSRGRRPENESMGYSSGI